MVNTTLRTEFGAEEGIGAEEVTSVTLPDELVENIIARMPYPSIFKCRLLSKSWLARFQPISSLHTEEEKLCAKYFQKQVTESSTNWDTFCLYWTLVGDSRAYKAGESVVYNQAPQKWQVLPPLSLLQHVDKLSPKDGTAWPRVPHLEGAFLYDVIFFTREERIFVVNILTGEGRVLPVHSEANLTENIVFWKLVIDPFLETFKVIVFCEAWEYDEDGHQVCVMYIYNSKTDLWKREFRFSQYTSAQVPNWRDLSCAVHNGVLYIMTRTKWDLFLAFYLEAREFTEIWLTFPPDLNMDVANLVILDDNLVMIGTTTSFRYGTPVSQDIRVFKVDLDLEELLEEARCPALELDEINERTTVASQADCVFFSVRIHDPDDILDPYDILNYIVVEYNKRKGQWRAFTVRTDHYYYINNSFNGCFNDGYFRPGLNPFMAI